MNNPIFSSYLIRLTIGIVLVFSACDSVGDPSTPIIPGFVVQSGRLSIDIEVTRGLASFVATVHREEIGIKFISNQTAVTICLGKIDRPIVLSLRADRDDNVELFAVLEFFVHRYDGGSDIADPISRSVLSGWMPVFSNQTLVPSFDVASFSRSPMEVGAAIPPSEQTRFTITADDFEPQEIRLDAWPAWADTVNLSILKQGEGNAMVSRISYFEAADANDEKWNSSDCSEDDPCAIGYCKKDGDDQGTCVMCLEDAHCPGEGVCAQATSDFFYYHDVEARSLNLLEGICVEPGNAPGNRCVTNVECSTSICCEGVCSTCCENNECENGQACQKATNLQPLNDDYPSPYNSMSYYPLYELWLLNETPFQCAPGQGLAQKGDYCLVDDDCESKACSGEERIVIINKNDEACDPYSASQTEAPAGDHPCFIFGFAEGRCE